MILFSVLRLFGSMIVTSCITGQSSTGYEWLLFVCFQSCLECGSNVMYFRLKFSWNIHDYPSGGVPRMQKWRPTPLVGAQWLSKVPPFLSCGRSEYSFTCCAGVCLQDVFGTDALLIFTWPRCSGSNSFQAVPRTTECCCKQNKTVLIHWPAYKEVELVIVVEWP